MSRQTIAYQPALDGTRALAVTVVLLFHGGISWMTGGYLGVSVFFTLSGYLITSLLLAEHEATGRVAATAFYTRRARRLLPASVVCLVAVALLAWAGYFDGVANLRRDTVGALLQVFNWVKLFSGESYGELFNQVSGVKNPLDHYWSLAIEEQFYWVWPLAFVGLIRLGRRTATRPLVLVGGLTALSAGAAPVIARVWGPEAAYWATPARISEILAGALVACWLSARSQRSLRLERLERFERSVWSTAGAGVDPTWGPRSQQVAALAPLSLLALGVACVLFPPSGGPAYNGALPLVAACSAALIVGLQAPGPVREALSVAPLVFLGKISYGVYLYHWPVFVLVDRRNLSWPVGVTLLVKCAITFAAALASYYAIEKPIRTATWLPPRRTLVGAMGGTVLAGLLAWVILPSTEKYYGVDDAAAEAVTIASGSVEPLVPLVAAPPITVTVAPADNSGGTAATESTAPPAPTTTELAVPSRPVRIVVVGDSTAEATGAGIVAWAAANPAFAQVELVTGAGCGLVMGGYLDVFDAQRDVDADCGPYVYDIVPDRITELQPDVVMVMVTVWDVLDRQLVQDGPPLPPSDPAIRANMAQSLGQFTDSLLALGVPRVVWVQSPTPLPSLFGGPDQQAQPDRHKVLRGVIAEVAAARVGASVVDLAGWLGPQEVGQSRDARSDGVHFSSDASLYIATELLGPALVQAALS